MRAIRQIGIWITTPARSSGRCLSARPSLRRNDTWHRLRPDVGDHFPDGAGRHHAAICRHAAGTAVEDRLKQRAVRTTVAPATVDETRPHPAERATTVTAVAVHRAENLRAVRHIRRITAQRALQFPGGRLIAPCRDMIGIADRCGRAVNACVGAAAGGGGPDREQD